MVPHQFVTTAFELPGYRITRNLGVVRASEAVESAHRDDVGTVEHHERFTVVMVNVGEPLDLVRRQVGVKDEEPQPRGLVRQPVVEANERLPI